MYCHYNQFQNLKSLFFQLFLYQCRDEGLITKKNEASQSQRNYQLSGVRVQAHRPGKWLDMITLMCRMMTIFRSIRGSLK